jgi:hypothetical protein
MERAKLDLSKGASASGLDMRLQAFHAMASSRRGGCNNDRLSTLWRKVISLGAVAWSFFNYRHSNIKCRQRDATSVKSNEGQYERQQFEVGDATLVSGQLSRHENRNLIAPASR